MQDVERALQSFHSIKIRNIMPPITSMPVVTSDSPILNVLKLLRTRHHVWVVEDRESMRLVGAIRYLDIVDVFLPLDAHKFKLGMTSRTMRSILGGAEKAEDVVERNVLTIDEDATVLDALTKMRRYKSQVLAVVQDDRLVGEISLRIVIDEFLRLLRVGEVKWTQHGSSSRSE
ncbi:CBS domain-containing protein [Thermococcus profundus]|uniref:CBS domain-containing protein n=1 Tax=Thermococcus profundus TaxID=49899 RepID=A0A2Z2ME30_THEPR|nr:CBS domain-containing protein [Thermococcus profundus]ASJ02885.1 CBS domain-containing protein [Thermococcus profundus]